MLWPCSSAVSVFGPALAAALVLSPPDGQLPLFAGNNPTGSILKRYPLSQLVGGRDGLDELHRATELLGAQVLQVGSSHVDVLFKDAEQSLPSRLFSHHPDYPTTSHAGSVSLDSPNVNLRDDFWDVASSSLANSTYHAFYHPLDEIHDFMHELAAAHPALIQLVNIGHSGEGREMLAMKISSTPPTARAGATNAKKAGFVITGAQHAREWIATSTALFLAHSLVSDPAEGWSLYPWLDSFDFYLVPAPNPDGYIYTWEHERFWYKNRQNIGPNEQCTGIDMNRNWGYKWKAKSRLPSFANATDEEALYKPGRGADADPCSTWYPGHRAWEAPEVNNIANWVTTLPSLRAYIDLRSYGQMLSTPYSFSCKKSPKDAEDQMEAALGAVKAIQQVHGTAFTAGTLCEQLYKASGNVVDYMYARASIKFSYSVHLRDTGTYGFSLPAEWIRPVGEETANMIRFLAGFISKQKVKA